MRQMMALSLAQSGYDVTSAEHGLDALVKIDRANPKPDLLIVDIRMPELDGLTLVRALRKNGETRRIPVIFVTAETDPGAIAEGVSMGARYYVTKPFRIPELLAKVETILAGRG